MDSSEWEESKKLRMVEDLELGAVVEILERENLGEFRELVEEKGLDGRKVLNITEGIVKLWRPKANARKLINFIESLKRNPQSYMKCSDNRNVTILTRGASFNGTASSKEIYATMETKVVCEGTSKSTLKETRVRKISKSHDLQFNSSETIERIFRYAEPPASFLYRNNMRRIKHYHYGKEKINSSYVPMDVGSSTNNQERKNITSKISDYIRFDLRKLRRFSRGARKDFDDRGYYALNKEPISNVVKDSYDDVGLVDFGKSKKKISIQNEILDDHFYEDLNMHPYQEIEPNKNKRDSLNKELNPLSKSPCILKLNEIFSTFRFPMHNRVTLFSHNSSIANDNDDVKVINDDIGKKSSPIPKNVKTDKFLPKKERVNHIYENNESSSGLYDSIEIDLNEIKPDTNGRYQVNKVPVEEYLEPINLNKEYADVAAVKEKEHSIVNIVWRMFENGFGFHKECEKPPEPIQAETTPPVSTKPSILNIEFEPPERPMATLQRWNENLRANHKPELPNKMSDKKTNMADAKNKMVEAKTNMADRPLPVPVENEFYYMDVDRLEASKLLEGHPDGTFILRPSSQPFHAYSISVVYQGKVHNVGIRRRPDDGRLALGFSKRREQSFASVTELVEHHYKEKILLIVDGVKIGSTQLMRLHG